MQMNIMQEQKTTHMTPAESPRSERRCYTVEEVMEFLGLLADSQEGIPCYSYQQSGVPHS